MGAKNFFNSILYLLRIKKKSKSSGEVYEETMKERSTIKIEIKESLKKLEFTDSEIKEVLEIADKAEKEIELLKAQLIDTNITSLNNDSPHKFMEYIQRQIDMVTKQMSVDLKAKVQEILLEKHPEKHLKV